jgi:hypothetical protein
MAQTRQRQPKDATPKDDSFSLPFFHWLTGLFAKRNLNASFLG